MSPACLQALARQKRINDSQAPQWRELYLAPLAEWARSAGWYRSQMWAAQTPVWVTRRPA